MVVCITSIIIILILTSIYNLYIHQIDVKIVFFNGKVDEEIYMKQLKGFTLLENKHKICKLIKSLYVLKKSHKQWHEKFNLPM